MGLFDKLFGRKGQDAETPGAEADRSRALERLAPRPAGPGDPRLTAVPPAAGPVPPPRGAVPREVARLRLYVPIPHGRPPRSWLGGSPRLPDPFTWPHGDKSPFHFVAQVDCSELPAGLWRGAGPRSGWLAFFIGTRKGYVAADVLYAATLGPERPAPARWTIGDMPLDPDAPDDWRLDPPAWPVEVLAQREGEPDIWRSVFAKHETPDEPYPYAKEVIDLARPEYQPHDWESLRALLTVMQKKVGRSHETTLRRLTSELAAQSAPPPDRVVPATIHAEAVAAAARFAALEAALPWDPQLWVPYAQAAARWRTLLLQREMEAGAPLAVKAGSVWHYATALIRAVPSFGPYAPNREGPADPQAYRRLLAMQSECQARTQAMRTDPRLPPDLVGEGGARRQNEEGYRSFRAERPEVWAEYANVVRESFAELAAIETALRLKKKPDPFSVAVPAYLHAWPQSHDEASALLREWVTAAERDLTWATAPRPDRSDKIAAARVDVAAVEAVKSSLASMLETATAASASGAVPAWEEWRPQVEAVMATHALRGYESGILHTWNQLRSTLAVRAYAANPAAPALPAPVLAYFLERWRYEVRFEMACMGGVPHGYTDVMDEGDEDRTALLLELPDSKLLGWSWGDVSNLVLVLPMDALRRGDFSAVAAGVTN